MYAGDIVSSHIDLNFKLSTVRTHNDIDRCHTSTHTDQHFKELLPL